LSKSIKKAKPSIKTRGLNDSQKSSTKIDNNDLFGEIENI